MYLVRLQFTPRHVTVAPLLSSTSSMKNSFIYQETNPAQTYNGTCAGKLLGKMGEEGQEKFRPLENDTVKQFFARRLYD